jgi:AGZA family xanthine/uracil permease-like MFS transporter
MTTAQPTLWTPGDWHAFFGFGTNIVVVISLILLYIGILRGALAWA